MHSCTITITGEEGRIIGLLCINLYLNTPLHRFLGNFVEARPAQEFSHSTENFVDNPVDLITAAVTQVRDDVLADANITAQNRNKEIVSRLAARGIFKLKDSVVQCADLLGISKNMPTPIRLFTKSGSPVTSPATTDKNAIAAV